jgi:hypothetical protein
VIVLSAVNVEGTAIVPTVTGDRTEQVTGLTTVPAGLATAQVSVTDPVNPSVGVTLIDEVLPAVAPCTTVMLPPLPKVNEGVAVEPLTVASIPNVCTYLPVESWPMISTL